MPTLGTSLPNIGGKEEHGLCLRIEKIEAVCQNIYHSVGIQTEGVQGNARLWEVHGNEAHHHDGGVQYLWDYV